MSRGRRRPQFVTLGLAQFKRFRHLRLRGVTFATRLKRLKRGVRYSVTCRNEVRAEGNQRRQRLGRYRPPPGRRGLGRAGFSERF